MKRHYFILLLLIISSCARVSSPQGGPEDETAPTLIISVPKDQQTDYKENTITLTFDEWVTTKNIEADLIITPKIETGFKTRIKKQQLQLIFNEPFQDSTTYTFSFASTVTDITNDNAITGLTLSFATGPTLDSLQISGTITNLYEQEPAEEYLISLYRETDSLTILDGPASYYTKTDTSGNYKFQNLPSGKYRIYALNDKNDNSKADSEEERIGFYTDTLELNNNLTGIDFTTQNLDVNKPRIINSRPFGRYYDIEFNKDIDFNVIENTSLNKAYQVQNSRKIRFYNTSGTYNDTTSLIISAIDSARLELIDTLRFYFIESKIEKDEFTTIITPNSGLLKPTDTLLFKFSKPVISLNTDSLHIELDSVSTYPLNESLFLWNDQKTEIKYPITSQDLFSGRTNALLQIKSTSFISIENDTLEAFSKNLSPVKLEDIASIEGEVFTQSKYVIVQLLNSRTGELQATSREKKFKFNYLNPGQYQIRVIDDKNGNGKWDIGNILLNEAPEPAYYHFDDFYKTRVIEVRKRWEQVDRNISF